MLLTAATVTDISTQTNFVSLVHNYASAPLNVTAFALEYIADTGMVSTAPGGLNRCVSQKKRMRYLGELTGVKVLLKEPCSPLCCKGMRDHFASCLLLCDVSP